jgi:16S rRNA C967 or C1407 C5-methylase (RsmB/RsmF family)/NOL1/NOP2/fmu family ribosome biogenesis protein
MQLPTDFITRTARLIGDYPQLDAALHDAAPVSIRRNSAKTSGAATGERVKWCSTGYYLASRPPFTFDPLLHGGAYYVQEAASMFLEQAIGQYVPEPVACLDLCAAPGGKSTHLLDLLPAGSVLVSNETVRSRCAVLAENVAKWGAPNAIVTGNDPAEIGRLTHLFDVIVADMPCSGEGMFRKDARSRDEWSLANVRLCAARQQRIAHSVWDALRPGGLFIYSTCTFNREENEDNVRYIAGRLGAEALPLPVDADWNVCCDAADGALPVYRFFPHRTKGEGFALAVLRKAAAPVRRASVRTKNRPPVKPPAQAVEWIRTPERYRFETCNGVVHAIPDYAAEVFGVVAERLHLFSAGVPVGRMKGNDLIPSHALALATALNRDAFPAVGLTWNEAVRYLQKETPAPPEGMTKGLYTVTYEGLPLGFARNIGTRVNNLYPQEWRIRSRDLPTERPRIVL